MKLAVLSGKGGAGKTFVAVNLAVTARQAVYIDCDVEEPNGRLFLKPEIEAVTPVSTLLPEFDTSRCNGCRACVNRLPVPCAGLSQGAPHGLSRGLPRLRRLFPGLSHRCCPGGPPPHRDAGAGTSGRRPGNDRDSQSRRGLRRPGDPGPPWHKANRTLLSLSLTVRPAAPVRCWRVHKPPTAACW